MINMGLYYYEQDLHTSQEGLNTLAEVCTCVVIVRGIGKCCAGARVAASLAWVSPAVGLIFRGTSGGRDCKRSTYAAHATHTRSDTGTALLPRHGQENRERQEGPPQATVCSLRMDLKEEGYTGLGSSPCTSVRHISMGRNVGLTDQKGTSVS